MKSIKRAVLLPLLCCASALGQSVFLWFDPSPSVILPGTNTVLAPDGYVLWMTTNPATDFTNWSYVTNFPAEFIVSTSKVYWPTTNVSVPVSILPTGSIFFALTYTNSRPELPDPSNTAAVQGSKTNPKATKIQFGK